MIQEDISTSRSLIVVTKSKTIHVLYSVMKLNQIQICGETIEITVVGEEDVDEYYKFLSKQREELWKKYCRTDSKKKSEELRKQVQELDDQINWLYQLAEYKDVKEKQIMAVMISEDKKDLIVTCKCGCQDAIHIKIDDEDKDADYYAIQTYMNGNWYRDQDDRIFRTIGRKLKKIWAIIRNKDYYYSDVLMSCEDFKRFKEYINQF